MEEYLYQELSYRIIGAAMEVHKLLGPGFLEMVYEKALAHEFSLRKIPYYHQKSLFVKYKEIDVGKYRPDIVVDNKIILEIKSVTSFSPAHESQAHHYLIATGLRLALLLNFGAESLQIKRIIR
jgi:GxxExxY protein